MIYTHIVDHTLLAVQVWNDLDVPLVISWKTHLSYVVKYEANECYLVNSQNSELAAFTIRKWANWIRMCFQSLLITVTAFHLGMMISSERKITHEVTVYRSNVIAAQIATVMYLYSHLWTNQGNLIKVLKKEWMNILLIDD